MYLQKEGDIAESLRIFKKLSSHKEVPLSVYHGYIRSLFQAERFNELLAVPLKVWDHFKDNAGVQIIRAKALLFTHKHKKAQSLFQDLTHRFPDDEQVMYYATVHAMQQGAFDKAQAMIEQALANKVLIPKHFLFYFLQSKVALARGEHKKALELAQKSVELYPRFAQGYLFKAMLEERLGRVGEAITGFRQFLDLVGSDEAIEKQLVHLLFAQQRYEEAAEQLQKIPHVKPSAKFAYYFDLALVNWKAGKREKAFEAIDKAINERADFTKARILKIEMLLEANEQKKALSSIEEWITKLPNDVVAYKTLLLLKKVGVDPHLIIDRLKRLTKSQKKNELCFLALADISTNTKQYKLALSTYKKAFELVRNKGLKSKILFQMGYLHYVLKEHEKMEETLEKSLSFKPVYPSSYNLLAYHYAEKEKQLPRALTLIDNALKRRPHSHYYLDTKGYVLLKMGRTDKALSTFKRALSFAPHDATVQQHYVQASREAKRAP